MNDLEFEPMDVDRTSWSQSILTLVSVFIGAALTVAAADIERRIRASGAGAAFDVGFALRAVTLFLYMTGTFWFYYNHINHFYRRATIAWVMFPSLVGCALIVCAYALDDQRSFSIASLGLFATGCVSFAYTIAGTLAGQHQVTTLGGARQRELLQAFQDEMVRNLTLFAAMALVCGLIAWSRVLDNPLAGPDATQFAINGALYLAMVTINHVRFTRVLAQAPAE